MSQVNLASMFLGNTTNSNVSSNDLMSVNSGQEKKFSDDFQKAKHSMSGVEKQNIRKNTENLVQRKQDNNLTKNDSTKTSDKKKINDNPQSNTTKDKEVASENVNKFADNQEENTDVEKVMDEQILAIMSQVLQIPVEEVQMQLEALGIEVKDLLTEEGFGQFIIQLYADGDVSALLSGDIDIKQLSGLFDQLTTFAEEMQSVLEENIQPSMEALLTEETVQETGSVQPEVIQENELIAEIDSQEIDVPQVSQNEANRQDQTLEEHHLSFGNEEAQTDDGLGITVPIHNFTTKSFTQTFETESGVVVQTTTKQVINGKAFIDQIDFKVLSQSKEIQVSLSPKELGQMNIKIVEQNGMMVAEIKVDNEKAKEFILNEIASLKESLEEQGLNVTDVKVDIRQDNHQAQMEQEKQKSSKRIQEIIAKHLNEEDSEEETVDTSTPIIGDSEIDYMV